MMVGITLRLKYVWKILVVKGVVIVKQNICAISEFLISPFIIYFLFKCFLGVWQATVKI